MNTVFSEDADICVKEIIRDVVHIIMKYTKKKNK